LGKPGLIKGVGEKREELSQRKGKAEGENTGRWLKSDKGAWGRDPEGKKHFRGKQKRCQRGFCKERLLGARRHH